MDYDELLPLLEQLKEILALTEGFCPDEDNEVNELLLALDAIRERLEERDALGLERLAVLFSQAGALHSIALDNGWEEIFEELALIVEQLGSPVSI